MSRKPLFAGLIVDEKDRPVELTYVGEDPCYVVDDDGFLRHIPSEEVDRQVLESMAEMIQGHEDLLSEQAAKMLGQDDIFSRALISQQLKDLDKRFDEIFAIGLPEETRMYLAMIGFRIRINYHGEVLEVQQPDAVDSDED